MKGFLLLCYSRQRQRSGRHRPAYLHVPSPTVIEWRLAAGLLRRRGRVPKGLAAPRAEPLRRGRSTAAATGPVAGLCQCVAGGERPAGLRAAAAGRWPGAQARVYARER